MVREYVGTGPFAEQIAEADALFRRFREQEAQAQKKDREHLEAIAAPVEELCEAVEILARATPFGNRLPPAQPRRMEKKA